MTNGDGLRHPQQRGDNHNHRYSSPRRGGASMNGRGFGTRRGGGPQGRPSIPRVTTCYKCGGPNHFARDCQAHSVKCYACGKNGHISKDCNTVIGDSKPSTDPNTKTCYKCGIQGHIVSECPN